MTHVVTTPVGTFSTTRDDVAAAILSAYGEDFAVGVAMAILDGPDFSEFDHPFDQGEFERFMAAGGEIR